jgi:hypothetical protein
LLGFAKMQFPPDGMQMDGITIHQAGGKFWASPPGKPWIGQDGQLVRELDGRPRYAAIISRSTHGARRRWSDSVLAAVVAGQPEALGDFRLMAEDAP